MLYTVGRSPGGGNSWHALVRYLRPTDAVVLLQDGVIAGLNHTKAAEQLIATRAALYALQADLVARGLLSYLAPGIVTIDYTEFVGLTVCYTPQIAW